MINILEYKDIQFPNDFMWGATTAGQQVEGNNNSFYDDITTAPKYAYGGAPYLMAGKACNSYEMYKEDTDLLKQMHLNTYRMSLEWSRIEPEEGVFNEEAIQHYVNVLKHLKDSHIKVCLTLHHNSHPVWFHKLGAFKTMDNINYFLRYVEKVVPIFDRYVDYWLIINEMNIIFEYTIEESINLLQYHAKAYHAIKKYSSKPVSSPMSYADKKPMRGDLDQPDRIMAEYIDYMENEFFLHAIRTGEIVVPFHDAIIMPELKDTCDFWAVNVYTRQLINSRKKMFRFDRYEASSIHALDVPYFSDDICPEVMYHCLNRLRDKEVLITENGIACKNDQYRVVYIASMLQAVKQAMDEGVKVIGYLHWSLLDNWEWGTYVPTFGLASVDHETFERKLKPSAYFYGDIVKKDALTQEVIKKHYKGL